MCLVGQWWWGVGVIVPGESPHELMEQGGREGGVLRFLWKNKTKVGPLQWSIILSFSLQRTLLVPPLKEGARKGDRDKHFSPSGLFGRGP